MDSFTPKTARTPDRVPLHIRLVARWALISLLIAFSGLFLASLQPPGWTTIGLKVIIGASGATGVTALVLWVIFSGVRFAFGRRDEGDGGRGRDIFD
jgi:hypothetical protein